jgi:hypothetical protein
MNRDELKENIIDMINKGQITSYSIHAETKETHIK